MYITFLRYQGSCAIHRARRGVALNRSVYSNQSILDCLPLGAGIVQRRRPLFRGMSEGKIERFLESLRVASLESTSNCIGAKRRGTILYASFAAVHRATGRTRLKYYINRYINFNAFDAANLPKENEVTKPVHCIALNDILPIDVK